MALPPPPEFSSLPTRRRPRGWVTNLLLVASLALGSWLSTYAIARPAVGVIYLETDIWYLSAWLLKQEIAEARNNPQVKAVVFVIDSPGGEVAPTQDVFLELLSLRQEMPVVGSINAMAASGGYYLALATDPIYAKPSSTIGNIGVWGFVPEQIGVNEQVLASGPFKLTASNPEQFLREIEGIKQEFLNTTHLMRGDRLNITPEDISQGFAYSGRVAKDFGLIDALASQADAIAEAARQAGLANYAILNLEEIVINRILGGDGAQGYPPGLILSESGATLSPDEIESTPSEGDTASQWLFQPWLGAADPFTGRRTLPPGLYLLYDVNFGGER